ncbi:MAG: nitroreductase family protein [Chlamydiales bacterium]|nr:nitroreductase family protein [Chlamydiales bacterium]
MKILFSLLALAICVSTGQGFCLDTKSSNSIFEKRYSGYVYEPTKTVSKEQLKQLVEAARSAPSSYNDQPWYFVIADKQSTPDSYKKILNSLVEFNQEWAQKAPILIVVTADTKFIKNHNENRWGPYDTGAAAFAMALQASEIGLMAHQMGGFDEKKLQADLNIPSRYVPMAVIAIGYEAANQPAKPKERKSLQENFFMGEWGKGFNP